MRPTLRVFVLTALFFSAYSGAVMASSTGCRVALRNGVEEARSVVHKRVHHSAATLARWKAGAAAWSKAHGGKVYAGVPAPHKSDWTPRRFSCDDVAVALDLNRPDEGTFLAGETLPEFIAYGGPGLMKVASALDAPTMPQVEAMGERTAPGLALSALAGGSVGSGAGGGINGSVGPASFPSAPVPPTLAGPVPAPESPTIVLLGTGMLSFLVSKLRRRTVV